MTRLPAVLAVDGGGSKIDAVLLARTERARRGPRAASDFDQNGGDVHMGQVVDAVAAACVDAGLTPRLPVAELGVYCLAGADLPRRRPPDRPLAARAGGHGERSCATTRSPCCVPAPTATGGSAWSAGTASTAPAWRPTAGSPGSPRSGRSRGTGAAATTSAKQRLWHAIRAEDGRGPKTELQRDDARSPRVPATARRSWRPCTPAGSTCDRWSSSRPWSSRRGEEGDDVARSIIDRQADEVVALAGTADPPAPHDPARCRRRAGRRDLPQRRRTPSSTRSGAARAVAPAATVTVLSAPPVIGRRADWAGPARGHASGAGPAAQQPRPIERLADPHSPRTEGVTDRWRRSSSIRSPRSSATR